MKYCTCTWLNVFNKQGSFLDVLPYMYMYVHIFAMYICKTVHSFNHKVRTMASQHKDPVFGNWGVGLAKYWEHLPPSNVAGVWFQPSVIHVHVGWFCHWFSPCLESFFPGYLVFLPPEKPTFSNSHSIKIEDAHENEPY